MHIKDKWIVIVHDLQTKICKAVEKADGHAFFNEDKWVREEGGGGITKVIANGAVIEKGGVNTSVVHGNVTTEMQKALQIDGDKWFAAGISIVLHPRNPFVPTVHCNYRMFELYDRSGEPIDRWFGGGTDLTPYYLMEQDVIHFHQAYKNVCDRFDPSFYPLFKKGCDEYFVNKHRSQERRGVGGIFYDHKRAHEEQDENFWMNFGRSCGDAFIEAYIPIVEKRKSSDFTAENKTWQEIRRGRYVEFNLVHDRGTLFGLKTNGRTESILMSLPPTARFEYNHQPMPGSEEDKLLQVCLNPVDWLKNNFSEEEWARRANTC